jgi:hypothetical protein
MSQTQHDSLQLDEVGDRWLHIRWQVSPKTQARAESAMGRDVHRSTRLLRLHCVDPGEDGPPSKQLVQELELPGGVLEWFVRIPTEATIWQVEIGIRFGKGRFFSLLHSSPVTLSPRRARRIEGENQFSPWSLSETLEGGNPPQLEIQGTFVLSGKTRPQARVLVDDRTVPVDTDTGLFEWRLPLENGRLVVPVNVTDAGQIRRALLAIETNFHLLAPEPMSED